MKNVLALIGIILIVVIMALAILYVTDIFKIDEFILNKLKQNPQIALWFQTHEEVLAMTDDISQLEGKLAEKDQTIASLESNIQTLEKKLAEKYTEIEDLQGTIQGLNNQMGDHSLNVKEMADIYSELEPDKAAEIMVQLDDSLIIQIIKTLKKSEAAEILSYFPTERASAITQAYTKVEE